MFSFGRPEAFIPNRVSARSFSIYFNGRKVGSIGALSASGGSFRVMPLEHYCADDFAFTLPAGA